MSDESLPNAAWHASKGEQYKALYEYLKHTATLSAGSILLIATMLEKLFAQPKARGAVLFAVVLFAVSIIASSVGFIIVAATFPRSDRATPTTRERDWLAGAASITCVAFAMGVIAMAVFFCWNW